MNLPPDVTYSTKRPGARLISKDDKSAWISIRTSTLLNQAYRINQRTFIKSIAPYLRGDWETFDQRFRITRSGTAYSGAEHFATGASNLEAKLPNLTIVPNMAVSEARGLSSGLTVFGCTMGHFHHRTPSHYRIQEVYEFQSYGVVVLDREGGNVELWVAQDGDKVAIPNGCHMTLYNIDDENHPLVCLDFANPEQNPADKKLVQLYGPILLAYYDDEQVTFALNRLWMNHNSNQAGVHLFDHPGHHRNITIERGTRLHLGELIYEALTKNPDIAQQFGRLGIRIRIASPEATLEPLSPPGERLHFARPLAHAAKPGTEVYRYFFPDGPAMVAGPGQQPGIYARGRDIADRKGELIELKKLNRRLVIVVEGAGDWVEQRYRAMFHNEASRTQSRPPAVFYADDTTWAGKRPGWVDNLYSWETYLDKSDARDASIYRNLRPDVVFVVTPDFTHSAVTACWLGKAALVFVEKPFDSKVENVEFLLRAIALEQRTAVLGLDHYAFYALPVHALKRQIVEHLGGALEKIIFCMTEDRPIEEGRERTVQHGLTLDMLPHLPALLTYFGDVGTIDQITVLDARQYSPLISRNRDASTEIDISKTFRNETLSHIQFSFEDYSGNAHPISCSAVVGKGFSKAIKYLEVWGRSGNAIRVDLDRPNDSRVYPSGHLVLLCERDPDTAGADAISDPYQPARTLRIAKTPREQIRRDIYDQLLRDLVDGTRDAIPSTLQLSEALDIVRSLDRIWRAIQQTKRPWPKYSLGAVHPLDKIDA